MADKLQQRGGRDRAHRCAPGPRAPERSRKFGVGPGPLKRAVAAAGTGADQVEAWLREHEATAE
jgi:hypothetical protein